MTDYTTVDMTVRSLVDDILRTDVTPAGAVGWGFFDDNGELVSVPLGDLGGPAAPASGTGLATAIYEAQATGAQTVAQAGATWFGDVGIVTSGGKSIPLSYGTGYTFTTGSLSLLAAAGVQANDLVTYTYASGNVGGNQPGGPTYTAGTGIAISPTNEISATTGLTPAQAAALSTVSAPVVGLVGGVATGYATLELAINDRPTVIRLNGGTIPLATTPTRRFGGNLLGNGSTIEIADGAELQLTRYAWLYQCTITAAGTGNVKVVGAGIPGGGTVPPAVDCVQVVECAINAPLNFDIVTAYQGLALRGNSTVTNLASGGGPVYLYDLAGLSGPLPAGFTRYDKRPGAAAPVYTAGDYITISPTNVISASIAEPLTIVHVDATPLDASAFGRRHLFLNTNPGTYWGVQLPAIAGNLNKTLTLIIDKDATGLWQFTGGDFDDRLWAGESLQLQVTDTGYRRIGGNKIPMTCDIGLPQQGSQTMLGLYSSGGVNQLQLEATFLDNSPGMAQAGNILIRRSGRYVPQLSGRIDAQQGSNIQLFAMVNGQSSAENVAFNNLISVGAVNSMSLPSLARNYKVGDIISFGYYFSAGNGAIWNATDYQYFLPHFSVTEITF